MFAKSVIATTKLRIFDASLSTIDIGLDGYEKPRSAHIEKMKNTQPRKVACIVIVLLEAKG
jgi:hypothetical protein